MISLSIFLELHLGFFSSFHSPYLVQRRKKVFAKFPRKHLFYSLFFKKGAGLFYETFFSQNISGGCFWKIKILLKQKPKILFNLFFEVRIITCFTVYHKKMIIYKICLKIKNLSLRKTSDHILSDLNNFHKLIGRWWFLEKKNVHVFYKKNFYEKMSLRNPKTLREC